MFVSQWPNILKYALCVRFRNGEMREGGVSIFKQLYSFSSADAVELSMSDSSITIFTRGLRVVFFIFWVLNLSCENILSTSAV